MGSQMPPEDELDRFSEFRMPHVIKRCTEEDPLQFYGATISGSFALILTLSMCIRQSHVLNGRPLCMQRGYYRGMLFFPMVWAVCCWATLFCPLARPLAELFMGQIEAYAIYSFLVSSVNGECLIVIQAVQDYGPQRYFAVPPLGCFFYRCCKPHHISAKQLLWVSRLVKQFGVLQIFFNSYFLWARLTLLPAQALRVEKISEAVLKVSGVVAMYGLFIMYKATHDLLHNWNTTRKFVALKVVIVVSTLQGKLLSWLISSTGLFTTKCLLSKEHPEDMHRLLTFWSCYFTLLETVVLSLLIIKAFPAHEVTDYPLKNLDLVELELRQIDERRSVPSMA
ncbi:unnamed protein product [Cladocopium goreaui]|uniref:UBA domain-containing protein n=1 Tax=Cladocopium goreaui TaxID=2562237 RepID=A0A9P1FTP0_9DINO|nr:unnamed protein product [Cladocopium goreaui]